MDVCWVIESVTDLISGYTFLISVVKVVVEPSSFYWIIVEVGWAGVMGASSTICIC